MKFKKGFVLREMCGEKVVAGEGIEQINFNKLISLNESAAYLWEKVEGTEFDVNTLAGLLVERYGIDMALALSDSEKLLNCWKEIGVLE